MCDYPSYKQNPVVAGKRIIWEDERNGNTDLFMFMYQYYIGQPGLPNLYDYPLSYFLEKYLPTPSDQTHPHLYNNRLVFLMIDLVIRMSIYMIFEVIILCTDVDQNFIL